MTSFDRLLIDPTGDELAAATAEAVLEVARAFDVRLPPWKEFAAGLVSPGNPAEGLATTPTAKKHDADSPLAIAWWSDPHGRRHFRVMVRHRTGRFAWEKAVPPLFYVYPDRLRLRTREVGKGRRPSELIAACGCGVCGRPAELAWTSPCCGPCADHREERRAAGLPFAEPPAVLRGGRSLFRLAFSPDSRVLVGVERDGPLVAWDVATGRPAWDDPDPLLRHVEFAPTGDWFISMVANDRLVIVKTATGRILSRLPETTHAPLSVAIAPDRSCFVVVDSTGIWMYRFPANENDGPTDGRDEEHLREVEFTPDGQRLFISNEGGFRCRPLEGVEGEPWSQSAGPILAISADSRVVAVGRSESSIELLNANTGQRKALLPIRYGAMVEFHPRLRHFISADQSGAVTMWTLTDYQRHTTFRAQPQGISAMALSPDGRTLATAGTDGTVRLWPWEELMLL